MIRLEFSLATESDLCASELESLRICTTIWLNWLIDFASLFCSLTSFFCCFALPFVILWFTCWVLYLFIETYLYMQSLISSQAIFHMCPVVILLYESKQCLFSMFTVFFSVVVSHFRCFPLSLFRTFVFAHFLTFVPANTIRWSLCLTLSARW